MFEVVPKIRSDDLRDVRDCTTIRDNRESVQNSGMIQNVEKIEDVSELSIELEDLQVVKWDRTGRRFIVISRNCGIGKFKSLEGRVRCEYGEQL